MQARPTPAAHSAAGVRADGVRLLLSLQSLPLLPPLPLEGQRAPHRAQARPLSLSSSLSLACAHGTADYVRKCHGNASALLRVVSFLGTPTITRWTQPKASFIEGKCGCDPVDGQSEDARSAQVRHVTCHHGVRVR